MNEIQRLKTEAALRKVADDVTSSGTLSISNLALPLKKEFLTMLSKGGGDESISTSSWNFFRRPLELCR